MDTFLYQHNLENIVKENVVSKILQNFPLLIHQQLLFTEFKNIFTELSDFYKLVTTMITTIIPKNNFL